MATYAELQKQIADLQRQAEETRRAEVSAVIADIVGKVATYDLKPEDIFSNGKPAKSGKPRASVPMKYKDPVSGATWTGRGRAPKWLDGRNKDDFLIK